MIRLWFVLFLALGPAGAAHAQARAAYRVPPASRATPVRPAPATPAPPPIRSIRPGAAMSIGNQAQCRTSCARTRYQCAPDGDAFDCASNWSQCVARCG